MLPEYYDYLFATETNATKSAICEPIWYKNPTKADLDFSTDIKIQCSSFQNSGFLLSDLVCVCSVSGREADAGQHLLDLPVIFQYVGLDSTNHVLLVLYLLIQLLQLCFKRLQHQVCLSVTHTHTYANTGLLWTLSPGCRPTVSHLEGNRSNGSSGQILFSVTS